ncbi:MAG: hypothetical protein V1776_04705 [Candidatus Diapherotrites archaeon]
MIEKAYRKHQNFLPLLLFISILLLSFQSVSAQFVLTTAPYHICQSQNFFWSGFCWNQTQMNGVAVSYTNQIVTIAGAATSSYWNSEGRIVKRLNGNSAQVDIASADLPASASGASIWFTKDSQNVLVVEKHRDITDPQYNTNVFIVEKINGVNHFKYVSPDPPSANFDTYKIKKIPNGYEVYYNTILVYTGNLDLTAYNKIELVGIARSSGDQVEAKFRSYTEQ